MSAQPKYLKAFDKVLKDRDFTANPVPAATTLSAKPTTCDESQANVVPPRLVSNTSAEVDSEQGCTGPALRPLDEQPVPRRH